MDAVEPEEAWVVSARRVNYSGWFTLVGHDVRLPDGNTVAYEMDASIPFAAAVLVIDGPDVLLAREYRHPVGRWIYNLPGGAGNQDETPRQAAERELREELGWVAQELMPLHTFYPLPGRVAWPVHIFASTAGKLGAEEDRSDPAEQVRLCRLTVDLLDDLILANEIVDSTLLVARAAAASHGLLPPLGVHTRR